MRVWARSTCNGSAQPQSAGGPIHRPPADHVQMEVTDGIASVVAHVENQAITPFRQTLRPRHFVGQPEHVDQNLLVRRAKRGSMVDMTSRDDQDVGGRGGAQVPEGDGMLGAGDLVRGDLAGGDAAEDAVSHSEAKLLRDDAAARFLADARNIESARARAREHWIRQQAREGATFEGILRALSERQETVEIVTADSGRASGQIMALSAELTLLGTDGTPQAWVVTRAVAGVSPVSQGRDAGVASDDRGATSSVTLSGLLSDLAGERAGVTIRSGGNDTSGRVAGVGTDVVTVRERSGRLSYLPVDALTIVRLD